MASAESQGVARLLVSFHSDSAWCRFRLGQIGAALEDVHACISVAEADCDPDDLAASLARIAVILEAHGKSAEAAELRERSRKSLAEHIEAQTNLLALLFDVSPFSFPARDGAVMFDFLEQEQLPIKNGLV